jgi:hypothetical protein
VSKRKHNFPPLPAGAPRIFFVSRWLLGATFIVCAACMFWRMSSYGWVVLPAWSNSGWALITGLASFLVFSAWLAHGTFGLTWWARSNLSAEGVGAFLADIDREGSGHEKVVVAATLATALTAAFMIVMFVAPTTIHHLANLQTFSGDFTVQEIRAVKGCTKVWASNSDLGDVSFCFPRSELDRLTAGEVVSLAGQVSWATMQVDEMAPTR